MEKDSEKDKELVGKISNSMEEIDRKRLQDFVNLIVEIVVSTTLKEIEEANENSN